VKIDLISVAVLPHGRSCVRGSGVGGQCRRRWRHGVTQKLRIVRVYAVHGS